VHHLDFAEYWLDRAEAARTAEERKQFLSKARQEFVLANKLDDDNPETLAMYGRSFLLEGEDPAKGIDTLEFAHRLLPSEPNIKMLLASAYVAVGRSDEARPLLRAIIAWEHGEGAGPAAAILLAKIESETPGAAAGAASAQSP
jgi:cytochrome c-type biogenesis protein CcmH/NrfG